MQNLNARSFAKMPRLPVCTTGKYHPAEDESHDEHIDHARQGENGKQNKERPTAASSSIASTRAMQAHQ